MYVHVSIEISARFFIFLNKLKKLWAQWPYPDSGTVGPVGSVIFYILDPDWNARTTDLNPLGGVSDECVSPGLARSPPDLLDERGGAPEDLPPPLLQRLVHTTPQEHLRLS